MKNSVTKLGSFILNTLSGSTCLIKVLGSDQDFSIHFINGRGSGWEIFNPFKLDASTNPTQPNLTYYPSLVKLTNQMTMYWFLHLENVDFTPPINKAGVSPSIKFFFGPWFLQLDRKGVTSLLRQWRHNLFDQITKASPSRWCGTNLPDQIARAWFLRPSSEGVTHSIRQQRCGSPDLIMKVWLLQSDD